MVFEEAVIKQGILEKRGRGILVSWTTRWFVLTNKSLAYFTDHTLSCKKGEYLLDSSCSLDTLVSDGVHEFMFCLKRDGKLELMLNAPNLPTTRSWEEALKNVLTSIKEKTSPTLDLSNHWASARALPDSEQAAEMEGYLCKQDHATNSWKERWFVLTERNLTYYTDDTRAIMKGVVVLTANSSIVEVPSKYAISGTYKYILCLYSSTAKLSSSLERRSSFGNTFVDNAAAAVGMKRTPVRSALLLCAKDKESMLQWQATLNNCILKLRHEKWQIVVQVVVANESDGRIFTGDPVYKICTIVKRKVKYIAYHHFMDIKDVHAKIRAASTMDVYIHTQFPRIYKRNSFGIELGAEEIEQRRHQLELYLQELIGRYREFDFLNDLGGTNDVQIDIAALFGTTLQNLNDLIVDSEAQCNSVIAPSKIAGLFDKYQDAANVFDSDSCSSAHNDATPPPTTQGDSCSLVMPSDASALNSYNVIQLGQLCDAQNIDTSDYKSKKQYIEALSSTYQKALPYLHNKDVRPIVHRIAAAMLSDYKDSSVIIEIDKIFIDLMRLLSVCESLLGVLSMEYSTHEKLDIIERCVAVWDKDFYFTNEDANMIFTIQCETKLTSFMLLTLKYRMKFASAANSWMHCFCVRHGVSVLVAALDRCMEWFPLTERLAADMLAVLECFRLILQTDCRAVFLDTRGAVDAVVMSLQFDFRVLALETLELLSEVIIFGGDGAVWRVVHAFHHLAMERREVPFAILISGISQSDVEIQTSIVMLVNSIILYERNVCKRIEFRDLLLKLDFDKICAKFRVEFSRVHHTSSSTPIHLETQECSRLRLDKDSDLDPPECFRLRHGMYYSDSDLVEEYSDSSAFVARPKTGTMEGYLMEMVFPPSDSGYTWQVGDVVKTVARRLSGMESIMTSAAKDVTSNCVIATNRQWYRLNEGILAWDAEPKISKNKSLLLQSHGGCINLSRVKDIVDCSSVMAKTNLDLQNAFTLVTDDGTSYHFYVSDAKIKYRWLVALHVAYDRVLLRRSPYRLPVNKPLPLTTLLRLQSTFIKHMSIYDSVCKEDLALMYESSVVRIAEEAGPSSDTSELVTFIHYELKRHRNEAKFLDAMKDLSTFVLMNYAPRPPEEEDPRAVTARLPRAVPPNDKPIPAVPPLPFIPISKPAKKGKRKVKQIFWTKVKPVNVWNTVWMDMEEPENLSWSLLEELFGEVVRRRRPVIERRGSGTSTCKLDEISLFDAKRTQNVAIACGKLRRTPDEIFDLVVSMDPDELTQEVNDTIINLLLPTKEELECVRSYSGDIKNLDFVGKLFTNFLDIERLDERLRVQRIMLNWMDEARSIMDQLECVKSSIIELNDEASLSSFELVLATVLSIGNYMNGIGSRGQAHGFKLEVLLKLKNIKQVGSGKKHLLHFVVEQLTAHFPGTVVFYESWISMWRVSKVNLRHLETQMCELERAIEICESELNAASAMENEAIRAPLTENLGLFISRAMNVYQDLVSAMDDTTKCVQRAKNYFGESQLGNSTSLDDDPWQSFFTLLVRFADMYKVALNDINEWKLLEDKVKTHKLRRQDMTSTAACKQHGNVLVRQKTSQRKEASDIDMLQTFKAKMLTIRRAIDLESEASNEELNNVW